MMRKDNLLKYVIAVLLLASCSTSPVVPLPSATASLPTRKTKIIDYPPPDWSKNMQRFSQAGCVGKLPQSCTELIALGCDEITSPGFYIGGLQPAYAVMECIHQTGEPADREYFKQPGGLDPRYRSYVIFLDGKYRLIIKKSEFKAIFAPVESTDEALSYAMAMTSLQARFDLDTNAQVHYRVDVIEETHAVETPDGYLVYLFDWSHKMGCDEHPFYAVKVLVTPAGEVHEVERQEIYTGGACFDFEALTLDGN